jgi:hypothetical protein
LEPSEAQHVAAQVIAQAFDIWISPEVARRVAAGGLPPETQIHRAQIVFFPDDRPRVIRLNEEVRAEAVAVLAEPIDETHIGELICYGDVLEWQEITLPLEEWEVCGHITILSCRGGWTVGFDAVYFKGPAQDHLDRADQFWRSARDCQLQGDLAAGVDNLWSAVELAAKARLLAFPWPDVAKSKKHGVISARYNLEAKRAGVPIEYARTLNRLVSQRPVARYVALGELMKDSEFMEHLGVVERMISDCRDLVTARRPIAES